jgi:hypothetical protein
MMAMMPWSRAIHQNCWMGCTGCATVVMTQSPFSERLSL